MSNNTRYATLNAATMLVSFARVYTLRLAYHNLLNNFMNLFFSSLCRRSTVHNARAGNWEKCVREEEKIIMQQVGGKIVNQCKHSSADSKLFMIIVFLLCSPLHIICFASVR